MSRESSRDRIKRFIEKDERGRERKNKNRVIRQMIHRHVPNAKQIPRTIMLEIIKYALRYDRAWRDTLLEYPHLRGKDYQDKKQLEHDKRKEYKQ